jgi:hypothetical protein
VSISQAAGEVGRLVWVWHTQQHSLHTIYTKSCHRPGKLGDTSRVHWPDKTSVVVFSKKKERFALYTCIKSMHVSNADARCQTEGAWGAIANGRLIMSVHTVIVDDANRNAQLSRHQSQESN